MWKCFKTFLAESVKSLSLCLPTSQLEEGAMGESFIIVNLTKSEGNIRHFFCSFHHCKWLSSWVPQWKITQINYIASLNLELYVEVSTLMKSITSLPAFPFPLSCENLSSRIIPQGFCLFKLFMLTAVKVVCN